MGCIVQIILTLCFGAEEEKQQRIVMELEPILFESHNGLLQQKSGTLIYEE